MPCALDRSGCRRRDLGCAGQPFNRVLSNLECLRVIRPLCRGDAGGLPIVVGDEFGQGFLAFAGNACQPTRGRGVQAATFRSRQRLVGNLADQDVAKREDIGPGRAQKILIQQPVDDLVHALEVRFQGEQSRGSECASKHRAQLDDAALLRRQLVEAGQHCGLHRIRQPVRPAALGDRADQLAGKKRVTLRPPHDPVDQVR